MLNYQRVNTMISPIFDDAPLVGDKPRSLGYLGKMHSATVDNQGPTMYFFPNFM